MCLIAHTIYPKLVKKWSGMPELGGQGGMPPPQGLTNISWNRAEFVYWSPQHFLELVATSSGALVHPPPPTFETFWRPCVKLATSGKNLDVFSMRPCAFGEKVVKKPTLKAIQGSYRPRNVKN